MAARAAGATYGRLRRDVVRRQGRSGRAINQRGGVARARLQGRGASGCCRVLIDMASACLTRPGLLYGLWATTWARILDHCADMNGAPLTRTPPRRSWGRGPPPPGWRRIQARRSTCLLLRAVQRRRVESLVLGALSSSPVHRALVLVLGTNIAVLLDCSKSSRQCSLPSLLTYLRRRRRRSYGGRRPRAAKAEARNSRIYRTSYFLRLQYGTT